MSHPDTIIFILALRLLEWKLLLGYSILRVLAAIKGGSPRAVKKLLGAEDDEGCQTGVGRSKSRAGARQQQSRNRAGAGAQQEQSMGSAAEAEKEQNKSWAKEGAG